jgi:hypothetical protein
MVAVPPTVKVVGLAEQLMVGGVVTALTVTAVVADAVRPWSSATLPLTVIVPAAAPVVFSVAVLPVPEIVPEEALQLRITAQKPSR